MIEYLDKDGLDALWAKIKSKFVLKTEFGSHIGSMAGTIAGLQARISGLEDRIAILETGGGVTPTPTPEESDYGVVGTNNVITVKDNISYTSLKYVGDSTAVSGIKEIQ